MQLAQAEVGNANRAGVAELTRALHSRPGSRCSPLRPVNQIQIDIIRSEPLQAALSLGGWILARRIELGGDEHLVTPNATLAQRPPDAFLVAIDLGGVNVSVAEL